MSVYTHLFGKPDGFFIWLRCRALGHVWQLCGENCCKYKNEWCADCAAGPRPRPPERKKLHDPLDWHGGAS